MHFIAFRLDTHTACAVRWVVWIQTDDTHTTTSLCDLDKSSASLVTDTACPDLGTRDPA